MDKRILKLTWKDEGIRILKKEKQLEDSCCLKMHYKPTVDKTVWYLGEDRYRDQWNRK